MEEVPRYPAAMPPHAANSPKGSWARSRMNTVGVGSWSGGHPYSITVGSLANGASWSAVPKVREAGLVPQIPSSLQGLGERS